MNITKHLFIVFIVLCHPKVQAQLPDYYVYKISGEVLCSHNNKTQPLHSKDFVYKGDILQIKKEGAEVLLTDREGRFYSFSQKRKVQMASLVSAQKGTEGLTFKYLHLVFEELLQPSNDFVKFKSKYLTKQMGGVYRGCNILKSPADSTVLTELPVQFQWKQVKAASLYQLKVYPQKSFQAMIEKSLSDSFYTAISDHFEFDQYYRWNIQIPGSTGCGEYSFNYFKIASPQEIQQTIQDLEKKFKEIVMPDLRCLFIAKELEANKWFHLAEKYYKKSIDEARHPAAILLYSQFLLKLNRLEEAEIVWKEAVQ